MPCPPRRSPPDPQRSWPRPTGTLPITAPIGGSGLAPATPPRAVAAVARWRRPGVPEPPPSSSPPQTTTPAAAPLPGSKADRPRRPATGQCPLAAPYGGPGHSPPGASVRIWRRRKLCSSAWNRWRTQGMPEGQASLSGHTAVDLAGSGLRSDHHGPHCPLCQGALADAERAFGVCAGPSAPRHHHFAHPGWGSVRAFAESPHRLGGPCGGGS